MKRLFVLLLFMAFAPPAAAANFSDWAVMIVAGDWHDHDGDPSEVFDNARRDLGHGFAAIGFNPANIREFSVRPEKYPREKLGASEAADIAHDFAALTARAKGGCLVYMTSHGSPDGIVVDERLASPAVMQALLGDNCAGRPTVVILSACYSGVFVPALAAPNRMIFTAARKDRSSFGCGQEFKYTFFDNCILTHLPASNGFPQLADKTKACVAAREKAMKLSPPSSPQISLGRTVAGSLNWK